MATNFKNFEQRTVAASLSSVQIVGYDATPLVHLEVRCQPADLVSIGLTLSGGNVRFKAGTGFQWYNEDTGLWHTKLCVGDPPQDAWDEGEI